MSLDLDRTNMYPGTCAVCGDKVPSQRGYLVDSSHALDPKYHHKKWLTLCTASRCAAALVGQSAVDASEARTLAADGAIRMPYDPDALPLLHAIAAWDASAKLWRASPLLRHRDLVLEVAERLGLEIAAELREYEDPEPVRAAVARARAIETIREYQVQGVRWLAYRGLTDGAPEGFDDKKPGAILADDQGIGKSAQTLLSLHDDEALLVACPANAKAVWPREAKKWRPDRFDTVTICEGSESFKWPESPREMVVINYDILPLTPTQIAEEKEATQLKLASETDAKKIKRLERKLERNAERKPCGKPPCKVLVVGDEAHYVESNKALRTIRWRYLVKRAHRLYGLTGTPVESEPLKMWGLLTSCRCNPFSWQRFRKQFNAFEGAWGGIDFIREPPRPGSTARGPVKVEPGTTEILRRCLLRRTKEQVLPELPAKIYSEVPIDLSKKAIAELDEISAEHIDLLLQGELPPFESMAAVRKALASASVKAMLEIVDSYEKQGLPLVVFSAHRAPIETLAKRKGWYAITGDTSSDRRGEIEDEFQAGKGFGVAGTRAMAEAMTLTRASTVLFVDRFWERKYNRQSEDRCHRIGQKDCVNVITLVPKHPLTQHVADLLSSKYSFVDSVLHTEQGYTAPEARRTDVDESQWRAKVEAKAETDRKREEASAHRERAVRERALAKLAEREVTPQVSERRAALRAERLKLPVLERFGHVPAAAVQDALAYMLSVCDGARTKDSQGFNKPDGCVARWLAPGVQAGLPLAVASTAEILTHYPRQLADSYPTLFERENND